MRNTQDENLEQAYLDGEADGFSGWSVHGNSQYRDNPAAMSQWQQGHAEGRMWRGIDAKIPHSD